MEKTTNARRAVPSSPRPSPAPSGSGARRHSPTLCPVRPGRWPSRRGVAEGGGGEELRSLASLCVRFTFQRSAWASSFYPSPEGERGVSEAPSGGSDPDGWCPSVLGWVSTWVRVEAASGTVAAGLGRGRCPPSSLWGSGFRECAQHRGRRKPRALWPGGRAARLSTGSTWHLARRPH